MSDDHIVFIPTDPAFVPAEARQQAALRMLMASAPDADEVTVTVHEQTELVHPHANWSGVRCPRCKATLDDEWWSSAVDVAAASAFVDLGVVMPCCGAPESLNDLDYPWAAGFARFELDARNSKLGEVPASLGEQLSVALGTPLRVVYQHI